MVLEMAFYSQSIRYSVAIGRVLDMTYDAEGHGLKHSWVCGDEKPFGIGIKKHVTAHIIQQVILH